MSLEDGGTGRSTTDRREGRVTMEVGLGVMGSQAKECGQSPEAGRGEDETLPWSLWRPHRPCRRLRHTDCRLLQSYIPVASSHHVCGNLV